MDKVAPEPSDNKYGEVKIVDNSPVNSAVKVTIAGCGGFGINMARPFLKDGRGVKTLFFDTSMTNIRNDETVTIIANGSGSGSNRAENSDDIQREITKLSDDALGVNDVAIVIGSTGGGSGSVICPLLIREYHRKAVRTIAVVVADTSSTVGARNTLNTLKTLSAIAENNNIYLPVIMVTNDNASRRSEVDSVVTQHISTIVSLLTAPTYEVDRNDRLNWVSPMKVANVSAGLKLVNLYTKNLNSDPKIVLGSDYQNMVDSLLILLNSADDEIDVQLPMAKLKKIGFYTNKTSQIVGTVSSDISSIEKIIDSVEKAQQVEQAQSNKTVDRLKTSGGSDLIL